MTFLNCRRNAFPICDILWKFLLGTRGKLWISHNTICHSANILGIITHVGQNQWLADLAILRKYDC